MTNIEHEIIDKLENIGLFGEFIDPYYISIGGKSDRRYSDYDTFDILKIYKTDTEILCDFLNHGEFTDNVEHNIKFDGCFSEYELEQILDSLNHQVEYLKEYKKHIYTNGSGEEQFYEELS